MLNIRRAFIAMALLTVVSLAGAQPSATDNIADKAVSPEVEQLLEKDAHASSATQEVADMESLENMSGSRRMTREEKAASAKENDSWGGGITIISMSIVVGALLVLSLLFLVFGKISSLMMSNKKLKSAGISRAHAGKDQKEPDSGETIAAIAFAMSEHFYNRRHDLEDTILTIKRMRRNYSPWNSKIYNLREVPSLQRNVRK